MITQGNIYISFAREGGKMKMRWQLFIFQGAKKRCLHLLLAYLFLSIILDRCCCLPYYLPCLAVLLWKLTVDMIKRVIINMVKNMRTKNTCIHTYYNGFILNLGFQNDIEMSSISVIQVDSIFTWLSQMAIMKPFIIKPCVDVPSKHLAVAMILVSVVHIADSLIFDLFKYSLPSSLFRKGTTS